jgi:serine/threonine protein kinase
MAEPRSLLERLIHVRQEKSRPDFGEHRESTRLIEYMQNAAFKLWTRRIAHTLILCMFSAICLMCVCSSFPEFQFALWGFFRWILAPIKPLLTSGPSAQWAGLFSVLTPIAHAFNLLMAPAVGYLALKATEPPLNVALLEDQILILSRGYSHSRDRTTNVSYPGVRIKGDYYAVESVISLQLLQEISVKRPRGKKSFLDYVIHFNIPGKALNIRWGDIVKPEDRQRLVEYLEKKVPERFDATIFEPFKRLPDHQSYTELWLRELSGAPKRERLTPLAEGNQLRNGDYTILKKVGVGGQGTVYLATKSDADNKEVVVVKEFLLPIYPDVRVRKKAAQRFQAEASMLRRLNHPQIVKFLDLVVEDHRAYLVLEHVEGTTLKQMIAENGPMTDIQVVEIARQIANILVYLHAQEPAVNHRDLTPDNIILGLDGMAKLIDFSVAQEITSGVTGSVVGKPNYIAPEQFRGKPTTQSDLYSLGATLYYLLIGHDPPAITVLHPQHENEKISDAMDSIVARCTQLDPAQRYANATALAKDLSDRA